MAYFGIDDQTYGLYAWIVETLIIITITIAAIEARRLRTNRHRALMFTAYLVQWFMVITWMGRNFLEKYDRFTANPERTWNILTHAIIGSTVLLLATGLLVAMYIEPDIHVAKMKRGKPVMRTVYILWVTNYLLGTFNYFNRYYWKIPIY